MKFTIPTEVRGKIFRLYPLNWTSLAAVDGNSIIDTGRACLKWELYGCAELESEGNVYVRACRRIYYINVPYLIIVTY